MLRPGVARHSLMLDVDGQPYPLSAPPGPVGFRVQVGRLF